MALPAQPVARLRWAANSLRDHAAVARAIHIGRHERVLDVGSGGTPHPRANVLCDKFVEDATERHHQELVSDRPMVIGDVMRLPFADKSFDVVICAHVLEHVPDPSAAISELERVARRGYVECPSASWEKLQGFPFHRWLVTLQDGTLVFEEKPAPLFDPDLRHWFESMERRLGIKEKIWFARRAVGIYVSLVWEGRIPHRVIRSEKRDAPDAPATLDEADLGFDAPASALGLVQRIIDLHGRWARRATAVDQAALQEMLRCPACGSGLAPDQAVLRCDGCGSIYPLDERGRPHLLPPEAGVAEPSRAP
jgi:SAM-dependent methyltransferase